MGRELAITIIRVVSYVLLLGDLFIWIMLPTNTYRKKWMPTILAKLNSPYLGKQGFTLVVFTLPVLLVAVLSCVYLQLAEKNQANCCKLKRNGETIINRLARNWKKPMLVKGRLGIVSGTELTFLVMLMALLVWSLSTYLRNDFAVITSRSVSIQGEKVWEGKLEKIGLRLGVIGNICLALLFFPVTRGSCVLHMLGMTSEWSLKYHIWLGHLAMLFFTAHGLAYIIYWTVTTQIFQMKEWSKTGISNLPGGLSLLAGLVLWATTFSRIRRKMFELFFYTHYLYILFMLFFVFHVGISYSCIMLPGFYLFLIDRFLRFLQSRHNVRLLSARVLPCQTVELNFSKHPGLSYSPTSVMFMNVPSISKLQWHPFTVTSNSSLEPEIISVVIKSEGSWSQKLNSILSSSTSVDHLSISVEGPYGPVSTDFLRYDTLVMVSGGSGIASFISIIRELVFASKAPQSRIPQVMLICAFKYSSELTMLDLILPISETESSSSLSNLPLKIKAYVTREKEPPMNQKQTRMICHTPSAEDHPISSGLGPNSWLWLAAIISSSFIMFLIIIGLITRCYIYPVDHNTNQIFSWSLRSFLNMMVICICISMTATAAFFWNKKNYAKELMQIQNTEMSTSSASSAPYVHNGDRELESFPLQTLAEVTQVHYGERPNLHQLVSGCSGSSVGVLVSGPKKLRHDVASICSSSANNVHFESISFSW